MVTRQVVYFAPAEDTVNCLICGVTCQVMLSLCGLNAMMLMM